MQPDTPAQIIARVPKNRQESVVVALDAFKGTQRECPSALSMDKARIGRRRKASAST